MSHSSAFDGVTVGPPDRVAASGTWRAGWRWLRHDPVLVLALLVLAAIILLAIFAPLVAAGESASASPLDRLLPVGTPGHWLGTDEIGRDVWARLAFAGRQTLLAGIAPVMTALLAGGVLGSIAGLAGGIVGTLMMRMLDVVRAFPAITLPIAICGLFGGGLLHLVLALAIMFVPAMAGFAETTTAQVLRLGFVEAARASGTTLWQILRHHVLTNVLGPMLAHATGLVGRSIWLSAGLSFLGLGAEPTAPDWGLMLAGWPASIEVRPLVGLLPGAMIVVTALCFNLVAERFHGAMDARLAA